MFGQRKIKKSGTSSIDLNGYWYVTIVRENFIPDDTLFEVIEKLEEIPGLRLADGEFNYDYVFKNEQKFIKQVKLKFMQPMALPSK